MDKVDLHYKATGQVTSISDLNVALKAEIEIIDNEIARLAFSSISEDNYKRLKLLGRREYAFQLLSQI